MLRVAPMRLRLRTAGPFRAPEFKGALFRGGLGQFLRELSCVTEAASCAGCQRAADCLYSVIFESPVAADKLPVLRKYPNAPHPFVLAPPADGRRSVPEATELVVELTLIGPGIAFLPHFVWAFEQMGGSGRYGGRFRLEAVISGLDAGRVVYDGWSRRLIGEPQVWAPGNGGEAVRRMRLEFVTPLRMRTGGRYNARPDFAALAEALLRRIHLLSAIYAGGEEDVAWMRRLLAQADGVVTERADWRLYAWERTSGRQRRRVPMDGLLGCLEATGDLTELANWFRLGQWLHIGSATSLGMGRYRIWLG